MISYLLFHHNRGINNAYFPKSYGKTWPTCRQGISLELGAFKVF